MENGGQMSEMDRLTGTLEKIYKRYTYPRAFFSGILAGLGSAIGATVVFALVLFLLSKVNFIPIIGDWLGQVIDQAIKSIPSK